MKDQPRVFTVSILMAPVHSHPTLNTKRILKQGCSLVLSSRRTGLTDHAELNSNFGIRRYNAHWIALFKTSKK